MWCMLLYCRVCWGTNVVYVTLLQGMLGYQCYCVVGYAGVPMQCMLLYCRVCWGTNVVYAGVPMQCMLLCCRVCWSTNVGYVTVLQGMLAYQCRRCPRGSKQWKDREVLIMLMQCICNKGEELPRMLRYSFTRIPNYLFSSYILCKIYILINHIGDNTLRSIPPSVHLYVGTYHAY